MDDHTWNRLFKPYKALGADGVVECGVYVHVRLVSFSSHFYSLVILWLIKMYQSIQVILVVIQVII